jgi:DNA gyrase/topoisomerase IV, subunit A
MICRAPSRKWITRASSCALALRGLLTAKQSKSPSFPFESGQMIIKSSWRTGSLEPRRKRQTRRRQKLGRPSSKYVGAFSVLKPILKGSQDYREYHTTTTVHFVVTMSEKDVARAEAEGLEKFFKLTTSINCTNMICFDSGGKIRKYETPEEILEDFYPLRLQYYQKRKVCYPSLLLDRNGR